MSINLQNYKINKPFPRSPSFTVTGNERKRKKTACKSRKLIMRISPSGKRSENAGIHSFFLDSAVITVS